jgi:hypothetical protein
MSMNFSEFKKLIGADPLNREPETLRARQSSAEFEAAAAEAEAFEEKLQGALNIEAPTELLADIKAISRQAPIQRRWMPLAIAASMLIAVGAAGLVWKQSHQWDSVEAYVADHYSHDGSKLVAQADSPVPGQDVQRIMARLDAEADQKLLGRVTFIKFCPTPDGRGAHMVVSTDQGPMTIIFMPETQVADGNRVEFEQMHALLVSLEHGSAAIIGEKSQSVENLAPLVRESIKPGFVGA